MKLVSLKKNKMLGPRDSGKKDIAFAMNKDFPAEMPFALIFVFEAIRTDNKTVTKRYGAALSWCGFVLSRGFVFNFLRILWSHPSSPNTEKNGRCDRFNLNHC
jgi:hypothetical protein